MLGQRSRRSGANSARRWLQAVVLAAASLLCGPAAAEYELGARALERGDYVEAWVILRPLAESGDARAQHDVGAMHALGLGVPQSYEEAAKWLGRSAAAGNALAQARLGWMHYHGLGVERDLAAAEKWSRLAAEQGDPWAQSNLGFLYDEGQGVAQDRVEAAKWYRRSAQQGFAEAQRNLGLLYEHGLGVERDLRLAYAWYGVAAAGGDERALLLRAKVAKLLDAQALEAAREAARELFQRHGSHVDPGG